MPFVWMNQPHLNRSQNAATIGILEKMGEDNQHTLTFNIAANWLLVVWRYTEILIYMENGNSNSKLLGNVIEGYIYINKNSSNKIDDNNNIIRWQWCSKKMEKIFIPHILQASHMSIFQIVYSNERIKNSGCLTKLFELFVLRHKITICCGNVES